MAKKTGDQSSESRAKGDTQQVQLNGADIIGAEGPAESNSDYKPLFDDENSFSKDDLTGDDPDKTSTDDKKTATSESRDEKKTEEKKETDSKKEEEKKDVKTEEKKDEVKTDAKKDEQKVEEKKEEIKPPPGYVAQAALTEERTARKKAVSESRLLKSENEMLKQEITDLRASMVSKEEEFKELTDDEFNELAEDDPSEAAKYQRKLTKHLEAKRAMTENARQINQVIQESYNAIEETVPGLYKTPELQKGLVEFAVDENDFDENMFEIMTNPETMVIIPSDKGVRTVALGSGAVSLIRLVNSYSKFVKDNNPKALRESIEAEMRTQLEKEIAAKLTKKLKTGDNTDDEFRQLGNLSRSDAESLGDQFESGMVSDADLTRMSEADRRRYLGG